MDEDRRGENPGRRYYDQMKCPFHDGMCSDIKGLEKKSDNIVGKEDFRELRKTIESKMDKVEFWKILGVGVTAFLLSVGFIGWLAAEQYGSKSNLTLLSANQIRLMKHFELKPIESIAKAKSIIESEK